MAHDETAGRPPAHHAPAHAVLASLGSDPATGLSHAEARRRLERHGPNALPIKPPVPGWRKFLAQFQSPLTILLLVATAISFAAWLIERESSIPFETLTILAIVLFNAVLGYVQEARAEQAVAALQALATAQARVLREGAQHALPSADLVPGDIILIEEGDTLPADGRLVEAIALRVAESALTGESTAVSKHIRPVEAEAGIGDQRNMIFSSTAVTTGRGRAVITGTGAATEIGKIAGTLQQTVEEPTPLQKELDRVGKILGIIVIAIAVAMSATIILISRVRTLAELVDVLLLAVSLAVAAVPEGLTAITTIVLSLGMQRMTRTHVIVRKLSAVETLGSTTVICTDKTGTLTKNEMTVRAIVTAGGRADLTGIGYAPHGEVQQAGGAIANGDLLEEVRRTLRAASLANNAHLVQHDERWAVQGDPTEGALIVAAHKAGVTAAELDQRFFRVGEVPFTSERKLMTTAHEDRDYADALALTVKGAPDVLLARCTAQRAGSTTRPLTEEGRQAILASVEQLAGEALRTIGVAYRVLDRAGQEDEFSETVEEDLVWLGVVGMIDPPRPEARESVRLAQAAGIRVMMITGDHPSTASAIGAELGILKPGEAAVSGAEIQRADEAALRAIVRGASVFARVAPEHKLRIVQALKANGEIVAMTGDGVNDAPALKTADIGVAMGITGTDVSKGAADMILTDDNFASIVAAVEEGRSIFANIQKFLLYLLSSNIGEVLVMFLGVVAAGALGLVADEGAAVVVPLLATQILWINLLTDSAPALALGIEPADHEVMDRPPRDPRTSVITGRMWFDIGFIGLIMGLGTLLVMDWALPGGMIAARAGSMRYAHTLAFTTLVFFQLFNVFNARFFNHSAFHKLGANRWLWLAVAISLVLQVAVIYVPLLQEAFSTVPLTAGDWLVCVGVGSSVLWLSEIKKLLMRGSSQ